MTLLIGASLLTVGLASLPAAAPGTGAAPTGETPLALAIGHADHPADLSTGLHLVDQATRMQAGSTPEAPAGSTSPLTDQGPGQAALSLADTMDAEVRPDQRAQVQALQGLPSETAAALTDLLTSFQALHTEAQATFDGIDQPSLDLLVHQAKTDGLANDHGWEQLGADPGPLLDHRAAVLQAGADLSEAIAAHGTGQGPDRVDLAPALVLDLVGTSDTYTQDVALVVDVGGDDTYHTNAGGSGISPLGGDSSMLPAAALFDLGGQDAYGDAEVPAIDRRGQGANGGAMLGVGLLVDTDGDDTYAAYADGVNGGAFAGIGLLLDTDGHDRYLAEGWGANGGGYPAGIGQLIDLGGADTYQGSYEAVNGGAFGGSGLLWDTGGDDTYDATRFGVNGGGVAGHGILIDEAGDDRYNATLSAVNGGADTTLGGHGLLYDGGGTDVYQAQDAGAGTDVTVIPKGPFGAQWDR